jgi:hypothetical protein
VKYLEARMVTIALQVDRVTLKNGNAPNLPALPRADRDAMEEFLGPARLLLAALGFNALQPITKKVGVETDEVGPSGPLSGTTLYFRVKKRGINATGASTDEGFVVMEGSIGDAEVRSSLSKGWRALREDHIADGSIVQEGDAIRFTRDVLFSSPSAAAAVVAGGVWNGRAGWKDEHGTTLGDLEDALVGDHGEDA